MSFVSKAVQQIVDQVFDHVKEGVDDYADVLKRDVEVFVDKTVRRAVKAMAIGLLGAVAVSAGVIFSLIGLVTYLSEVINPGAAWGLVGLAMVGLGAALLFTLQRRGSHAANYDHHSRHHNGGN